MFDKPLKVMPLGDDTKRAENHLDVVLVGTWNSSVKPNIDDPVILVKDPLGSASGLVHKDPDAIAVFLDNNFLGFIPKQISSYLSSTNTMPSGASVINVDPTIIIRTVYDSKT